MELFIRVDSSNVVIDITSLEGNLSKHKTGAVYKIADVYKLSSFPTCGDHYLNGKFTFDSPQRAEAALAAQKRQAAISSIKPKLKSLNFSDDEIALIVPLD